MGEAGGIGVGGTQLEKRGARHVGTLNDAVYEGLSLVGDFLYAAESSSCSMVLWDAELCKPGEFL